MHRYHISLILSILASFLMMPLVFASPYENLKWGSPLEHFQRFSHKENLHCVVNKKSMRHSCETTFSKQPARADFYIDSELGLYKIDFRMRIGTFRSGMAKSLDQNFRKKSRSLARSLIKRYGEASGYIKKKQLAYWTNLDNGATKLKYWIQTQPYHLLRASYESTNIQSQIEENKLLQAIQNLP